MENTNKVKSENLNQEYYGGGLVKGARDQMTLPSVGVIVILVISFIVLKKFIYIKDPKRHDK